MAPIKHIIVSVPLAVAAGMITQSFLAGIMCFFSGFIIDIDHLIEYILYYGLRNLHPQKVYQACAKMAKKEVEGGVKRIFLILHTGEIAILLWISFAFTANIYLFAIALGYTGHLILDALGSKIKSSAYLMGLRIKNNFATVQLVRARK